jgi:UrcA family protein
MDTTLPSSKQSSPIVTGVFSTVLAVGAVLWVIGGAVGVAAAQTSPAPSATQVSYSDLNLSTEDGARTLLRRINIAANTACGDKTHSPLLPRAAAEHDRCVATATKAAIGRVDSQMVAEIHRAESAGTLVAAR